MQASGTDSAIVTITLQDIFSNPISGKEVFLHASGSGHTLIQPDAATDSSGKAMGYVTAIESGTVHLWATVDGVVIPKDTFVIVFQDTNSGIDGEIISGEVPKSFALQQNFPNPFNPQTTIRFEVPNLEMVSIAIYNNSGQKIRQLLNKQINTDTHSYLGCA